MVSRTRACNSEKDSCVAPAQAAPSNGEAERPRDRARSPPRASHGPLQRLLGGVRLRCNDGLGGGALTVRWGGKQELTISGSFLPRTAPSIRSPT
jgi:hypothetical protein